LVQAIKSNNIGVLKQFYSSNYLKIETMVLNNNGSVEQAKDIYQAAFIDLWRHVKANTFVPQSETDLQNYLYKIAKNKCGTTFKVSTKPQDKATLMFFREGKQSIIDNLKIKKLEVSMDLFKTLDQPCKQLLKACYFEKKPLNDIASDLNIDTHTAAKNKYCCLEKLRKMVFNSKQLEIETS